VRDPRIARVSEMQANLHREAADRGDISVAAETVESPVRGDSHAGFGGRLGETDRE
jgi:hypothetical protein